MRKASKRRVPAQERSRERVARILDAAAHEFAERGVEAATIESIAERAETSVGSIYQFFPNKLALYEAIGDKYLEEVRALFAVLVSDDAIEIPWREIINATIDAFANLHRTSVTFRAVWSNIIYSRRFFDAGQALNRELADRAEVVFGRLARAKRIPPAKRKLLATVTIETMSALLLLSTDKPRGPANALLDEAKMLVQRYLEPYLD
jgi:AcrR family transcriptional regulator